MQPSVVLSSRVTHTLYTTSQCRLCCCLAPGHSSDGKLASLLNDHHYSPTSSFPPSSAGPIALKDTPPPPHLPKHISHHRYLPPIPHLLPSPLLQSLPPAYPQRSQQPLNAAATVREAGKPKKKHVCPTCSHPSSTLGHLSRHQRIHTRERNHKCPSGCETRCSRQDDLQQ